MWTVKLTKELVKVMVNLTQILVKSWIVLDMLVKDSIELWIELD